VALCTAVRYDIYLHAELLASSSPFPKERLLITRELGRMLGAADLTILKFMVRTKENNENSRFNR
jgi:hypothetical protein